MGYYSDVALALPKDNWEELKSEIDALYPDEPNWSECWVEERPTQFDPDWVVVLISYCKFYSCFPEVQVIRRYLDSGKEHEFVRVGEEEGDIESQTTKDYFECLSTKTIIEVY